ncbi:hypothetical protein [Mucilaginibacter sp. NFR10]|uniref:hypothetical protein n=1 Tax=Mucilaginibacter sp. NFR10 TaxID=1566292 RepID=UPI000871A076|nr:hypothetical protein [Mucilaginibacter sp. NFR10]SCW53736.1 hypothetical protein SAMN03159284_01584 [Mucilaginibacter sp. NFR10]
MAILDQLWPTLWQLKHNSIVLNLLVEKYQNYNRRINLLIVLASSSSVGAWAVWKQFPIVWSSIIIASQIATVIKPYFPYTKYIREFNSKCSKVDIIVTELEFLFAKKGSADEKEMKTIERDYMNLKREINKTLNFSDDLLFKTSKKMEVLADKKLASYLKINYDIDS